MCSRAFAGFPCFSALSRFRPGTRPTPRRIRGDQSGLAIGSDHMGGLVHSLGKFNEKNQLPLLLNDILVLEVKIALLITAMN